MLDPLLAKVSKDKRDKREISSSEVDLLTQISAVMMVPSLVQELVEILLSQVDEEMYSQQRESHALNLLRQ